MARMTDHWSGFNNRKIFCKKIPPVEAQKLLSCRVAHFFGVDKCICVGGCIRTTSKSSLKSWCEGKSGDWDLKLMKKIWWWSWKYQIICRFVCFWIHLSQQVTGFRTFFFKKIHRIAEAEDVTHLLMLCLWHHHELLGVSFLNLIWQCALKFVSRKSTHCEIFQIYFSWHFFSTLKVGNFRMKPTLKYSGNFHKTGRG